MEPLTSRGERVLLTLTHENFDSAVLSAATPILVEFVAAWCSTCRAMEPVVRKLARAFAGYVQVGTLDVEAYPDVADRYGVRGLPTLLLFQHGEVVGQTTGFVPAHVLAGHLKVLVSAPEV